MATTLTEDERAHLLRRLEIRRLGPDDFVSDEDLVVGEEGLTLDETQRRFEPKVFKPSSLEDLLVAVGPRPEARKKTDESETLA